MCHILTCTTFVFICEVSQLSLAHFRRCSSKKNQHNSVSHPGVCHHWLPHCSTGACAAMPQLRESCLTQLEKSITKKGVSSAKSASCFNFLCWQSSTAPTQREGEQIWSGRDWNCTFQQQWRPATRGMKPLLLCGVSEIPLHQFSLLPWGLFFSLSAVIAPAMLWDCACSMAEKRGMLYLDPWFTFTGSVTHTSGYQKELTLWLLLQVKFQTQTPLHSISASLVFTSTCI